MATRLITAAMAARLATARQALRAAYQVDSHGAEWWQGVADAEQQLADLMNEQANAMFAAVSLDAPERELEQLVRDAAAVHHVSAHESHDKAMHAHGREGRS